MSAPRGKYVLGAALVVLALAGCSAAAPASPTNPPSSAPQPHSTVAQSTPASTPTPAIDPGLAIGEHLVTQEGLAIALASNVLQSQLQLVSQSSESSSACQKLAGGGSLKVSGRSGSSLTDHIYYDTKCAKPYIVQPAKVTMSGDTARVTATARYTALDGSPLGSMTTTAHADFGGVGISLEGLGTFTGTDGFTATLGLACQSTSKDTVLDCQGGVAQDFSTLGRSLGSVTPLRLTIGSNVTDRITFAGSKNSTSTGAIGAVTIASPGGEKLKVDGGSVTASDITTKGRAGGFVLFPPTPTGWTVTDATHDVTFTIAVTDNTTRTLAGTVTRASTGEQLASFAVDRSGTGTIAYDGQEASPITSWLLER